MKQIIQSFKSGETSIKNIPVPSVSEKNLLIRSKYSLISSGTERMLIDFGKSNLLEKAKQQPDRLKDVINKIKSDGFIPTFDTVMNRLNYPLPLGYCNIGEVVKKGGDVENFEIGDLVISNGSHAEIVSVPHNLCAKVPSGIDQKQAAFTILASISLQGIRLANPTLGESVVVIGLGLVGLITVQLLKANGCKVLGVDLDDSRIKIAEKFGANVFNLKNGGNLLKYAHNFSNNYGVDKVIITATSKNDNIVNDAAKMCRKRGHIILVGTTDLKLDRNEFYKKELTFQVSCSYGPGRYDKNYEGKGLDYPIGFVRWTQKRNFETILSLIADESLDMASLISHEFDFDKFLDAYDVILNDENSLGVLFKYPQKFDDKLLDTVYVESKNKIINSYSSDNKNQTPVISFLGSGQYSRQILIPAFKKNKVDFRYIASKNGLSSTIALEKFGFLASTTNIQKVLDDKQTDAVIISTQHGTHADLIVKSLKAGKDIYVEKPLCLSLEELGLIEDTYNFELKSKNRSPLLMVGFNRRFSPHVKKIKNLVKNINGPMSLQMTVNAGFIDEDSWVHDPAFGGGRIIGEVCHFIDLLYYIVGCPIVSWKRTSLSGTSDNLSLILNFNDGSIGIINYFNNGSKSYQKERLEIFADGAVLNLNNFRTLYGHGWKGFKKLNLWSQDKGHNNSVKTFLGAISSRKLPIAVSELFEVSKIAIDISRSENS